MTLQTETQTIDHQATSSEPFQPSISSSSSSNLIPDPSYIDPLIALAPTPINLSNLVHSSIHLHSIHEDQVKEVFNSAYLSAASSGDSDLIEWLLSKDNDHHHHHHHHHLTSIPNHLTRQHRQSSQATTSSCPNLSILRPGEPRKYLNLNLTDQDGTPPIILAAALGHPEAVRAIVDGIGGNVVDSRDSVGWTALHWAARNGDFTIVSYLLNHGATTNLVSYSESSITTLSSQSSSISTHSRLSASSLSTLTSDSLCHSEDQPSCPTTPTDTPSKRTKRFRGLRPYDLAKRGPEGDDIRHILRMAEEAKADALLKDHQSDPMNHSRLPSCASIKSPRTPSAARQAQNLANQSQSDQLRELASLAAKTLDLDFNLFGFPSTSTDHVPIQNLQSSSLFLSTLNTTHSNHLQTSNSIESWEQEQKSENFDWDRCLPDQMLVCSIDELPIIFDAVITSIDPKRLRNERFVPSNVIFLCARFAAHFGTEDLLEELILGALDQIEDVILAREDSMANSAFWLFNCCTLLYYLKREPHLNSLSKEYQVHLQDLINLIFVLIIRNAERRLDKVLDSSMLDFQPLPGFEHVEFEPEGSWRFVKALTVKRSRQMSLKPSLSSFLVGSPRSSPAPGSASGSSAQQTPTKTPTHLRSSSHQVLSPNTTPLRSNNLKPINQSIGPRAITDLLSSVLYVLQSYELHSSLVVQAFSQLFYWLGCELFNRIITRRKYLCRSKAMEIRLNVNVIEEWSRHNRLPNRLISEYFKPLNSILKWLQSISNEQVQNLNKLISVINELNPNSLNPVQMLKSLKDYRYEIDEPKMTEEGRTYLVKLQQDWDKKRLNRKEELEEREKAEVEMMGINNGSNGQGTYNGLEGLVRAEVIEDNAVKAIDDGLMEVEKFESYEPPSSPECLGELLDSRYMLPFGLPTVTESLVSLNRIANFGTLKFLEYNEPQPKTSIEIEEEEEMEELKEEEEETEESLNRKEMEKMEEYKKRVVPVPVLDCKVLNRLDKVREKHRRMKFINSNS